jgi:hypothetical protein
LTTTTPRRMQRLVTIETTMPQADCLVIDLTTPPSSTSTSEDDDDDDDHHHHNEKRDEPPPAARTRLNGQLRCRKSVSWKASLKAPLKSAMEKKSLDLASSTRTSAAANSPCAQRKPAAKQTSTRRNPLIESSDPFRNQWLSDRTSTGRAAASTMVGAGGTNDHVLRKCPCHGRDVHQRSAGIGGETRFYGRYYSNYPPSFQLVPRHWNDGGPYFSQYVTEAQFHALYDANNDRTLALDFCDQGGDDDNNDNDE